MQALNPFVHSTAAKRYARARPYFHPVAIALIREFLAFKRPVKRALDVACGTGQSCVALKGLAEEIVGTDTSSMMIAEAPADPAIRYLQAPAENLPFPDEHFDLIAVSSAFHWLDRTRFLAEANRLLPIGNWLVIYINRFKGRMRGNPDFEKWMQSSYLIRYPSPPRNWAPVTDEESEAGGFTLVRNESYENDVEFSVEGLADYLTTQSNIIVAVEQGGESLADVRQWLESCVAPMFDSEQETFEFGGSIWYLKKSRPIGSKATRQR